MTTPVLDRQALARVVAVANGKGGVGKTSTATHAAGQVAANGQRVLLIDLDPQGNTMDDLGYVNDDHGRGLTHCVMLRVAPVILRDVRPNLDVIPGGEELNELVDHLTSRMMRKRDESALLELAAALAPHVAGYDLVIIDCPPANSAVLQDAALAMARYLLVPTHSDKSSRKGLVTMAERWQQLIALNPTLELLGVILFGVNKSAKKVERLARTWLTEALGEQAPVFTTTIRHVEVTAVDIRETGRLAYEIPGLGKEEYRSLGLDYRALGNEVLARLIELETRAAAA